MDRFTDKWLEYTYFSAFVFMEWVLKDIEDSLLAMGVIVLLFPVILFLIAYGTFVQIIPMLIAVVYAPCALIYKLIKKIIK